MFVQQPNSTIRRKYSVFSLLEENLIRLIGLFIYQSSSSAIRQILKEEKIAIAYILMSFKVHLDPVFSRDVIIQG